MRPSAALAALLFALAACAAAAPLPLAELARGQHGGCDQPRREVVRDAARWAEVWAALRGDAGPAPVLDFGREMAVVVCLGQQRTGGHAVEIAAVRVGAEALEVEVRERHPAPDAITTQALTQPYHAVRVARSELPEVRWVTRP